MDRLAQAVLQARGGAPAASGKVPATGSTGSATAGKVPGSTFSGRYYAMIGPTLHTWEFTADGKFRHTYITSNGATSVRNEEHGTYGVQGDKIELHVAGLLSGYSAPGSHGTLLGGGSQAKQEVRVLKFQFQGPQGKDGIVLDGVAMKVKSW